MKDVTEEPIKDSVLLVDDETEEELTEAEDSDEEKNEPEEPSEEKEPEAPKDTEEVEEKIYRRERSVKQYQWFFGYLIAFLLIVWLLFFQVLGLTQMPNNDMSPRIDAGDLLVFYRIDNSFKFQNVVVYMKEMPDTGETKLLVGRVLAVGGDIVEISSGGRLIVNGNTLIEPKIFYSTEPREGGPEYPLQLGEDEYFILADSRQEGTDSRYFGPVSSSEIIGSVITVVRRNNP